MSRFVRVLLVAAIASLMVSGSLGFGGVASAGPPVPGAIVLHCTGVPDELQHAIDVAAPGSTIKVDGTCVNGIFGVNINENLTLSGPAIIDGNNATALGIAQGSVVVLNDLTIQHGFSPFQIGGGLGNGGQTTLNRTTVKENSADFGGGVFNTGQLTLNNSTVSDNTAAIAAGGIYNCGGNLGPFDCPDNATVTLNNSSVSDNVVTFGNGGGILNDEHSVMALNRSTVSGNTAAGGGGLVNNGTATINNSTLSGNTAFGGGAISNGVNLDASGITTASLTITNSTLQGNTAVLLGGAIATHSALTINHATVSDNSAGPCPGECFGFEGDGFGGAIFIFSQATTVAYSTFSNNAATTGADSPAGIFVQPPSVGGSGTFTATHSTFN